MDNQLGALVADSISTGGQVNISGSNVFVQKMADPLFAPNASLVNVAGNVDNGIHNIAFLFRPRSQHSLQTGFNETTLLSPSAQVEIVDNTVAGQISIDLNVGGGVQLFDITSQDVKKGGLVEIYMDANDRIFKLVDVVFYSSLVAIDPASGGATYIPYTINAANASLGQVAPAVNTTGAVYLSSLNEFADNAAAVAAGLSVTAAYTCNGIVKIVI